MPAQQQLQQLLPTGPVSAGTQGRIPRLLVEGRYHRATSSCCRAVQVGLAE